MRSFNPLLWYQRMDPAFDFNLDKSLCKLKSKERTSTYLCGYEFFKEKLCDGLLVSRSVLNSASSVRKENGKYKIFTPTETFSNIFSYNKIRKDLNYVLFADPGTWTYVNQFELPEYLYDQNDLIDYYRDMGFHLAGSVDWPIVDRIFIDEKGKQRKYIELDVKVKEHRRQLTLDLAEQFLKCCKKRKDVDFIPFGTIQGYSIETYLDSLKKILKIGYEYIAIGGLPSYSEKQVLELLPLIWVEVKKFGYRPGIHAYGRFPSPFAVPTFLESGITSFDNNHSFIAAQISHCSHWDAGFINNDENSPSFICHKIRIPVGRGRGMFNLIKNTQSVEEYESLKKLCDDTFQAFSLCAQSEKSSDLNKFLNLYEKMTYSMNDYRLKKMDSKRLKKDVEMCESTIKSKAWLQCGCTACRKLESHIMLERRITRSSYIFCHNTYVQYTRFQRELEKAKKEVKYVPYDWSKIDRLVESKNKQLNIKRKAIQRREG